MNLRFSFQKVAAFVALSLFLPAWPVLAHENSVSVFGAIQGHATGTIEFPTLQAAAGGEGTMSRFGRFTYSSQATVDLTTGRSSGAFVLILSNGDAIYGVLSGQGDAPPPTPPTLGHITEQLTIRGGTGRFQDASGSLTFDRVVDSSNLPAFDLHSGTVTGTISISRSAK
jgi:hypothetical protein